MRKGLTLQELADELDFQQEQKRDFVVSTEVMTVGIDPDGNSNLAFSDTSRKKHRHFDYQMSRHMMTQVAAHTKVPITIIDTMSKGTRNEQIAMANLLGVRLSENPTTRTVRTLGRREGDPYARAFLSDRYRALDNYDLAQAVLPIVNELDGMLKIESCDITETRLYIKLRYPSNAYDIGKIVDPKTGRKVGDIIESGVVISNSEVGAGSISVLPFLMRLICMNGAIVNEMGQRRNHVGRKQAGWEYADAYELFTDETKALDDAAFFSKVCDTVRAMLQNEELFGRVVTKFMETKGEPIKGHAPAVVQELAKRYTLNVEESDNVLKYLISGGDLSQFGMINAVTRLAKSKRLTYDRATELENVGGKIIELGPTEWKVIASAKNKAKGDTTPRRSFN